MQWKKLVAKAKKALKTLDDKDLLACGIRRAIWLYKHGDMSSTLYEFLKELVEEAECRSPKKTNSKSAK